jgi:signal transduction histidine kinase
VYEASVNSEEQERGRLARDLHDGLGPLLSACKLYLHKLKAGYDPVAVMKTEELINESLSGIREISNNISPHILRNFGLVHAVGGFTEKIRERHGFRIHFTHDRFDRFDEVLELTLYRILTELLNNTMKYANPKNVNLNIAFKAGLISLDYEDDGNGFDYGKAIASHKGFGLVNIRSRIEAIGGKILYDTSPGKGVKVKITVQTH